MDRGLRLLFWGFALSSLEIKLGGIPISGSFWGALVLLVGMGAIRDARPQVPDQNLRSAKGADLLVWVLYVFGLIASGGGGLLGGILVMLAYIARNEYLFLYLESSQALSGYDPTVLSQQRIFARGLFIAALVIAALSWLMPVIVVLSVSLSFAATVYQAWCMAQLRKSCGGTPMLPPGEDESIGSE